jgi:DNA modification methylase
MNGSSIDTLPLFESLKSTSKVAIDSVRPSFNDEIKAFDQFGQQSVEVWEGNIRYLVNEYWTSGQRKAHSIHEVSYRACFKAQLPEFFIKRLTKPGDAVYDPFMGRGTTPVQTALMGRRPIGNDINPLSILLTRPRLTPPTLHEVARRLDQIEWDSGRSTIQNCSYSLVRGRCVTSAR